MSLLYAAFPDRDHTTGVAFPAGSIVAAALGGAGRAFRFEDSDNIWMTKIGLNYKFGY